MYNTNIPSDREVPSTAKLIKSTVIAAVTAAVLLVTVVMPSEYGIDPTGIGNAMGLKRMGEIKVSLAKEAEQEELANKQTASIVKNEVVSDAVVEEKAVEEEQQPATKEAASTQQHEMSLTLKPDEGAEIKVTMKKGAKVNYSWETDGGKANFDVHGDSEALKINYHPYYKGSKKMKKGTLTAAFDGGHGWFWRNRTKETLTITIKTDGEYSKIYRQ